MLPAVITHHAMTRAGATLLDKAPFATSPSPCQRLALRSGGLAAAADMSSATASWFVDEYGTLALDSIITMLWLGHGARGSGNILV